MLAVKKLEENSLECLLNTIDTLLDTKHDVAEGINQILLSQSAFSLLKSSKDFIASSDPKNGLVGDFKLRLVATPVHVFDELNHFDIVIVPGSHFVTRLDKFAVDMSPEEFRHVLDVISDMMGTVESNKFRSRKLEVGTTIATAIRTLRPIKKSPFDNSPYFYWEGWLDIFDYAVSSASLKQNILGVLYGAIVSENKTLPENIIVLQGGDFKPLLEINFSSGYQYGETDVEEELKEVFGHPSTVVEVLIPGSSTTTAKTLNDVLLSYESHRHVYAKFTDGDITNCDCGHTYAKHLLEEEQVKNPHPAQKLNGKGIPV